MWVSARGTIDVSGGDAASAVLKINPGYLFGCQATLDTVTPTGTLGTGFDVRVIDPETMYPLVNGATNGAILDAHAGPVVELSPGVTAVEPMLDLEQPDDFGNEIHFPYNKVYGTHAAVTWTDETFRVDGCAGYAQARSFVLADIETSHARATIIIWGQPFSMG